MKNNLPIALVTTGVLSVLGLSALPLIPGWLSNDTHSSTGIYTTNPSEIVVDLKDNATATDIAAVEQQYGIDLVDNSNATTGDNLMTAQVSMGQNAAQLLKKLQADPRVETAEPEIIYSLLPTEDFPHSSWADNSDTASEIRMVATGTHNGYTVYTITRSATYTISTQFSFSSDASVVRDRNADIAFKPNDPRYKEQWNFHTIGVEEAWKRSRGKNVVVAVIDTGVAGGDVKKGKPCRDFNTTRFVKGFDFVGKSPDAFDDHGHGTHVAGTIAESTNNGEGVAGIAYEAAIMPLKVLNSGGSGTSADIADAIRFAADNGANVINMSLGSAYPSEVIHRAVKYAAKKGVVIVCAAGNSFGGPVGYPAAYKECIAVSAVGPTGNIAKYSSYGKEVALAAPGGDMIDSGDPADGILQNTNYPESQGGRGDDYYAFQGTSMASPHVAGVAALLVAQGVTDREQVREVLTKTATPKHDAIKFGAGVLNADAATKRAEQLGGIKLRHMLLPLFAAMLFLVGFGKMRPALRLAMGTALVAGMFGPDLFTQVVGMNSAWNLLGFSAVVPVLAYAVLRRGPGVKVVGTLALGTALNLYANWHNDTLPFTASTFGANAPQLWAAVNLLIVLAVGAFAAYQAHKATRRAV